MHERAELVAPSLRHARSYVAALREGFRRGAQDRVSERRISQIEADFARYIEAITDQTLSIRLPTGEIVPKVPFSVLWLVEGDEFIGETHIRHELNDHQGGRPRRLRYPLGAAAAGLRQADPVAGARGVPSPWAAPRAGHLS
jgi:predicted acetyltransferase